MDTIRFQIPAPRSAPTKARRSAQPFGLVGPALAVAKVLGVLAGMLVAFPALAQTTGNIEVYVTDGDGFEVPNADVTLSGERLIGGSQTLQTNDGGRAFFTNIPPGDGYSVKVNSPAGIANVEEVQVLVGRSNRLDIQLAEGEVIEVVEKEKAVDTTSTSRGTVLTKEFLQRVPSGRSYQQATQLAAGVAVGPAQGGNPNIGGAASDENTYMLDGANITDPVTGTFSLNFNFDAIQQIEVLLGGYMPEYGVSLGGIINLVTESGSNNLEFNSSIYYTNGAWGPRMDERISADGVTLAPTGFESSFQTLQLGAIVSGPVVRDKAFFILSYQHERSLINLAGIPQRRDYDAHYVLAKLTVQPSSEHRFTAFAQLDPTTIDNQFQGSPFIKAEAQGRQTQGGITTNGRWQWFLSPKANLDTTFTYQKSYIEGSSVPCTHDRKRDVNNCEVDEAEGTIDWETPGRVGQGGAFDTVNNINFFFDNRHRYNLGTKLSILSVQDPLGGTHDMKFGVDATQLVWDQTQGVNGNLYYSDTNQVPFDPESFRNYFWVEYSEPITFRSTGSQYAFFLQDSWKPISNLTVNYGTRFDNAVMRNDQGDAVLKANMFGPRLFAAWDPFGDQKTKVASGFGRFNDTGRLAVADFTSASGFGSKLYLGEFFSGLTDCTGVNCGFENSQKQNYSTDPAVNYNTAHDKLRNPYTDEVVLILEREVITDFALSSSMSGKFTRNVYEYDEESFIYSEDGAALIGTRYGNVNVNRARIRTPALAKRDVFQWDLEARKVLSRRWAGRVTYTYMQAFGATNGALSGAFSNDPQTQFNYGRLFNAQNHVFRTLAIWDLPTDPWTQQLGVFFVAGSGLPDDRIYQGVRIRERGSYLTLPTFWDLSIRFQQELDVRKGKLRLSIEAQNLTNNRAGGDLIPSFVYSQNRYVLAYRQDPLRLQVGAIYEF